jgi:hypothetical protein
VRPAWPAYRSVGTRAIPLACAVALASACAGGDPAPPLPRDLVAEFGAARVQPAPVPEVARIETATIAGASANVLRLTSPARLTWSLRLPVRADLQAEVAFVPDPAGSAPAGVTVRIGLSDDRIYDELFRAPLDGAADGSTVWQPIRLDLSPYSGWKWSLFYRPSRITWKLIVNADPTPGGSVHWRRLRVVAHGE